VENLIDYLASIEPGPITETTALESVLATYWGEFVGSDFEGMTADKLFGRMEDVAWDPPVLRFVVERHGATVLGSSRAELHRWTLNIEERTADSYTAGYRRRYPMAARVYGRPIAEELS
jgi:hypothetical protein